MKIRAMVTIKGLVQGVNYRFHAQQQARAFNVSGWVKNLPNGDVQGCFEGEGEDVNALIDWCRRGPSHARVEHVAIVLEPYSGTFADFAISY